MKFEKCPTKSLPAKSIVIIFLISSTKTPLIGPKAKDIIRAGSSEISSFINAGTNGKEKLNIINTEDIAEKTAVIIRSTSLVSFLKLFGRCNMFWSSV